MKTQAKNPAVPHGAAHELTDHDLVSARFVELTHHVKSLAKFFAAGAAGGVLVGWPWAKVVELILCELRRIAREIPESSADRAPVTALIARLPTTGTPISKEFLLLAQSALEEFVSAIPGVRHAVLMAKAAAATDSAAASAKAAAPAMSASPTSTPSSPPRQAGLERFQLLANGRAVKLAGVTTDGKDFEVFIGTHPSAKVRSYRAAEWILAAARRPAHQRGWCQLLSGSGDALLFGDGDADSARRTIQLALTKYEELIGIISATKSTGITIVGEPREIL